MSEIDGNLKEQLEKTREKTKVERKILKSRKFEESPSSMGSNNSGIIPQGLYSFLKSNEDFVKVIRNLETDFEKKTSYENFVKTPAEKSRMNRIQIDLEKEILASDEKWKVPEIMFGSEANEFSCDFAPESCPPALSNFGKEIILFLTFL